ncbi:hypothetical protein NBM05_15140, partial [Rothia sp. AR01]
MTVTLTRCASPSPEPWLWSEEAELAEDPGAVLDGVAAQYDLGPARGGVEQLTGGVRYREFEGG